MKLLIATIGLSLFALGVSADQKVSVSQLQQWLLEEKPPLVIDIRSAGDYQNSHLPGAINIPWSALERRKLPPVGRVVLYGSGIGREQEETALEWAAAKPGIDAYLLDGGLTAWNNSTLPMAVEAGVKREQVPMITYQEALVSLPNDAVIVDLRPVIASPVSVEDGAFPAAPAIADPVSGWAESIGRPLMQGVPPAQMFAAPRDLDSPDSAPEDVVEPLLVLIDDDPQRAEATARRLRAQGRHRVVVLVGGVEIIQFEGKSGRQRIATGITVEGLSNEP